MFSFLLDLFNFNILFTVIMLTVLFSITAVLAFIFRKGALKGKESSMYYIWLAVLVLAFIPIRIGEPRIILFPQENQQTQINDNFNTGVNKNIKFSDLINYKNSSGYLADESPFEREPNKTAENSGAVGRGDLDALSAEKIQKQSLWTYILKLITENKNIIISGLMILWLSGFIFMLAKTIYNYFKIKKLFYGESDICENDRVNNIFSECIEIVGLTKIKKRINLRIINRSFTSPCVCGLLSPTVFIDDTCVSLSDKKLRYIFIHELYHIKRYDMLYKILSVIVAGVHWFNPLTYKVVGTISEDCELSVDRHVMKTFGNEQSDYYMNIILDIAERKCADRARPMVNIPSASLFFGEKRNIDFLKRKYSNMKNITNKKYLIIALALFLAAIISINTIIMSSCGITGTVDAAANTGQLSDEKVYNYADKNVYEAAFRLYFNLLPGEDITQQQLDEITDIKIIRGINTDGTMVESINNIPLGGLTPVSFVINGKEFNMVPGIVHRKIFDEYIKAKMIEKFGEDSRNIMKLEAYYTIKDPNDPTITPEAKEEMLLEYPITAEYPIAVFDPNASEREYISVLGFFAEAGLLDDNFVQNNTIDVNYLNILPNLKNVTFNNINAFNADTLNNISNIFHEDSEFVFIDGDGYVSVKGNGDVIGVTNNSDNNNSSQPISGVFEAPSYGLNVTENGYYGLPDGTEYLEFKNESLKCAIAEYLASTPEYFGIIPWQLITTEMLSKITSISVRRISEYDWVFDYPEAQMPYKGMYLEYTINGKTLGILPEYYMPDIEQFFEMNSLDINQYLDKLPTGIMYDLGELKDFPEYYSYTAKAGLSNDDKLQLLSKFAWGGLARLAVYQNDDGSYFTVGRPDVFGFTPRYYDRSEYDATDIAYMPNLIEFNVDGLPVK